MAVFFCPRCGIRKSVAAELAGKTVRCPRCGGTIEVRGRQVISWWAAGLPVLLLALAGGGYYFFQVWQARLPLADAAREGAEAAAATETGQQAARLSQQMAEATRLAEQEAKLEADRRLREEQQQLETARLAIVEQRRELPREEAKLKEQRERLAAEQAWLARRRPTISATLEEIDLAPDRYQGKSLVVEQVLIQTDRIDKHADLGRPTLGAVSQAGKSYSRVPLNGLVLSTSDKLAADIARQLSSQVRVRVCGEVHPWSRKGSNRTYPELRVYRLEQVNSLGQVSLVLEDLDLLLLSPSPSPTQRE